MSTNFVRNSLPLAVLLTSGLAAGNALGGWWGAFFAVKGGEKFIRIVLGLGIFLIALKLFDVL